MNVKNDDLHVFRERLKYYRKKLKLTQAQLAEEINVSEHYIRLIENGYSVPSVELFQDICKKLDIPAYNFLQTEHEALRFTNPTLCDKLIAMDEQQLQSLLDTLFK